MPELSQTILLVSCPDRPGIVAGLASMVHEMGCNIVQVNQSVDSEHGDFRMRMVLEGPETICRGREMSSRFEALALEQEMAINIHPEGEKPRLALLCSREPHCLQDLLQRHASGELACEIPLIISNHETLESLADFFEVPFFHIPNDAARRDEAEETMEATLRKHAVNLVVLARYMQILSHEFVSRWPERIINIHHSFLPAFAGASPYRQAHERGVKLIGATAHYVTAELDAGPIIAQDVLECSHRDSVRDLTRKGRDVERNTLSRAVRWSIERRLMVQGDRVVVFG
ncbi:MAG TPA: formyltetrahydrofolate deformylase [Phycisphaerales bacterium]|nr:formyltetrahydrofolate deformylase [Phycisphaerales bacterium]